MHGYIHFREWIFLNEIYFMTNCYQNSLFCLSDHYIINMMHWDSNPTFYEINWRKLCMKHIIWANIFANIKLRDNNRHTWDHIEETFIRTIKCLNNPLGGWLGPQIFVYVPTTQRIQSQLSFMMVSQLACLANNHYKKIHV